MVAVKSLDEPNWSIRKPVCPPKLLGAPIEATSAFNIPKTTLSKEMLLRFTYGPTSSLRMDQVKKVSLRMD